MFRFLQSHFLRFQPRIRRCLGPILVAMALPAQAAGGATASTLAQPLLTAFQHAVLSVQLPTGQSADSLRCLAALPKDSFSALIQDALNQGLSAAELTAMDAYFSKPALSHDEILNQLLTAHYFKTPQVFAAFNARSGDLLKQCAIRQTGQSASLRGLA